jgi:hypothetical protein
MNQVEELQKEIQMGHLAKEEHQAIIAQLIIGFGLMRRQGLTTWVALPEMDIDPGSPESKCPDILLRNRENDSTPIIIEIAGRYGYRADWEKVRYLIEKKPFYGIEEGFVYNFDAKTWFQFSRKRGIVEINPSFSELLQIDLAKFLKDIDF